MDVSQGDPWSRRESRMERITDRGASLMDRHPPLSHTDGVIDGLQPKTLTIMVACML